MVPTYPQDHRHSRLLDGSLADLDPTTAARVISASADIAVVLGTNGVVEDLAFGSDELLSEGYGDWVGRPWIETVTVESRPKVEEMLRDASLRVPPRSRQVNHPSRGGPDLPVRYSALQIGDTGRVLAVGRELRSMAALQQRLVNAQQSMERDYARLRHAETRYRMLFQVSSEAVLVVDVHSGRVVEANPASGRLLGTEPRKVAGQGFLSLFEGRSRARVESLLSAVSVAGRHPQGIEARLSGSSAEVLVSASLFRQEHSLHYLVRLAATRGEATPVGGGARVFEVIDKLPDAFVVTDLTPRVLTANPAFLELVQIPTEDLVRDEPLERWLGRTSVDFGSILATLRAQGSIRHLATILRGEYGLMTEVEVSGVAVPEGEQPCLGFTLRPASVRAALHGAPAPATARPIDQLTSLVGRVPLKQLVRESTDLIERMSIEAALELTGDNRASAAEMLGLSRQSLYAKLHRHGLGSLNESELE